MSGVWKRWSALTGAVGLLISVGVGTTAGAAPSSPNLYVAASGGKDVNTCRLQAHPCATVAYAQTQAPPGATIVLSSGTFTAPIHIAQSVNLKGKGKAGDDATILAPSTTVTDTDSDSSQPEDAIVDVTNGATANISNLDIEGGAASPSFTGCGLNFVGVYFHDASGSVSKVVINGVELSTALFGCQDGLAAYVTTDAGSGTPSDVTFDGVTVTNYDKNGITCDDPGTTCAVTGDSVVEGIGPTALTAQNGIQLGFGASGSVTDSTSSGNSYTGGGANNQATGILVFDAGATTIARNKLDSNDVDLFAGADSSAVAGTWSITGNKVVGATDNVPAGSPGSGEGNQYGDGIQVAGVVGGTNSTTVSDNDVSTSFEYGIALYGTTGITVSSNTSNRNDDGIFVDSASSANTLSGNTARSNLRFDYEDASTGAGTAGTADTWTGNTCRPLLDSAPAGLC